MTFNPGDRVLYIGTYTPHAMGKFGIVVEQQSPMNVKVVWDDKSLHTSTHGVTRDSWGVLPENIKKVNIEIPYVPTQEGDRDTDI